MHLLVGGNLPSFTSFADHKKFFQRGGTLGSRFDEYESTVVTKTDWFDVPLKHVRDKYLVHVAARHMRMFGYSDYDLQLILAVPNDPTSARPLASATHILVSVRRLTRDIHTFLTWLNTFGVALREKT